MFSKKTRIMNIILVVILFMTIIAPACAYAQNNSSRVVTVAYYEKDGFTNGIGDLANKSGYGYEYLQKIAAYNGWTYKYVYGSQKDLYFRFIKGEIDIFPGYFDSASDLEVLLPAEAMGKEK